MNFKREKVIGDTGTITKTDVTGIVFTIVSIIVIIALLYCAVRLFMIAV